MKKSVKQGVNFAFAMTLVCSLGAGVAVWEANAATADVTEDGVYVGRAFDADYDKMHEDFRRGCARQYVRRLHGRRGA